MGEWWRLLVEHGHDWIQSAGIVCGLCFTALAFRGEIRSRQADHLIRITENHRALWTRFDDEPALSRIFDPAPDLVGSPITSREARFVQFVILHLHTTFQLAEGGLYRQPATIAADIRSFLSLPLPKTVWKALKPYQDADFIEFIDTALRPPR